MLQVAFLTGQSNPVSWALSPAQSAFLARLQRPERVLCHLNFPYQPDSAPHTPTPLLAASVRNGSQYLLSRRHTFADRYQGALITLLSNARHTVLLAGSCGLELLANLRLPPSALARVSVFAFGPVARHAPQCRFVLVQGRRDWISQCFFHTVTHRVDCGHMDYLYQDSVYTLCEAFIDQVALLENKPDSSTGIAVCT